MDGVLLDSSPIHSRAYLDTFSAFEIEINFDYSMIAGKSTIEVMSEIVSSFQSSSLDPEELTKYKQECVKGSFMKLSEIPLFPRVVDVLNELSKNFSLALCTSASRDTTEFFFRSGVNEKLFSEIVTSEEVSRAKPEPEIYLLAMQKLNVTASECLVIEDSMAGLKSGIASGANVCRIGDALSIFKIPKEISNQITNFESLEELTNYLKENNN